MNIKDAARAFNRHRWKDYTDWLVNAEKTAVIRGDGKPDRYTEAEAALIAWVLEQRASRDTPETHDAKRLIRASVLAADHDMRPDNKVVVGIVLTYGDLRALVKEWDAFQPKHGD